MKPPQIVLLFPQILQALAHMNRFLLIILLMISCTPQEKQHALNVLFIIVDDFRPEIGAWGNSYIQTPNIDQLVNKGISFKRAYSQYANCSPSRKSFLSGLSPETTFHDGMFNEYNAVMNHTTMPKYFKDNGYFTCSIGKVYHDGGDDRKSWDFFFDIGDPRKPKDKPWEGYGLPVNQNIKKKKERPAYEAADLPVEAYADYKICESALIKLNQQKDNNFFITVGFRKPHLPFTAPKKFWDLYDPSTLEKAPYPLAPALGDSIVYQWSELKAYKDFSKYYVGKNYRQLDIPRSEKNKLRHGYFACVSFVDELVGRLLSELKRLELDENTIVILVGDHGFHLGDQQIWGKHSCYELSNHVPLIIYDPTKQQEQKFNFSYVQLLDLYPTLAELCELPAPENLDGKSFAPLLKNKPMEGMDAAFNQYQSFVNNYETMNLMAYSIHTEDYNYIEWRDLGNKRAIVQRELYRCDNSRIEQYNLASKDAYNPLMTSLSNRIEANYEKYRLRFEDYQALKKVSEN